MTEFEVIELIILHASTVIDSFALFITFTFAYLTTAYFVGSKLSKLQTLIVSMLYIVGAGTFGLAGLTHVTSFETLVSKYPEFIHSRLWFLPWTPFGSIIIGGGLLASIYFMYDVRRKEGQRTE